LKVLISTAIWGEQYASLFARYSVASLLASGNLPRLAQNASITFQIITTRLDRDRLLKEPIIIELGRYCAIEWEIMQDFGIGKPSVGGGKYLLLSALQNIGIARAATDQDAIVFNYADFIWSDGSLPEALDLLSREDKLIDVVLGFCLPVDRDAAIPELDKFRKERTAGIIELAPRDGARIAIENMHREARIRFWDGPDFTVFPTYLIWPVDTHGVLIRAYHQSILALRVRPEDPEFARGIRRGTLDGTFTAQLAEDETKTFAFATDSDKVLVFSLYHTGLDSRLRVGQTRESSLIGLLKYDVTPGQRRFADHAICLRTEPAGEALWEHASARSQNILDQAETASLFDREAKARIRKMDGLVPKITKLAFPYRDIVWRLDYVYKLLVIGPIGALVRPARRLKRLVFSGRSRST
jgi:hypothetical protein